MTTQQFTVFCIFTGLVALALLIQGIALLIIAMRVRDLAKRMETMSAKITKQLDTVMPQLEGFLPVFRSMVDKVHAMEENVAGISKVAHERALKLDAFIEEATESARLQVARLQNVIETTSERIDDTFSTIQQAVVAPVNEVYAIARGIQTGVDMLFRRKSVSSRSHQEEEMFI
jgi:uncharacterized protein YoxC